MKNFKELLTDIRAFAFDVDGVLSESVIPMSTSGEPMRTANIKDGYAIQLAVKLGYHVAIITGGSTEAVKTRFSMLGVQDIYMRQASKIGAYEDWKRKHNLTDNQILYMGDDMPDLPLMELAGIATCPADACIDVRQASIYISPRNGGQGCARDVIEQTLRAQNNWGKDLTW